MLHSTSDAAGAGEGYGMTKHIYAVRVSPRVRIEIKPGTKFEMQPYTGRLTADFAVSTVNGPMPCWWDRDPDVTWACDWRWVTLSKTEKVAILHSKLIFATRQDNLWHVEELDSLVIDGSRSVRTIADNISTIELVGLLEPS